MTETAFISPSDLRPPRSWLREERREYIKAGIASATVTHHFDPALANAVAEQVLADLSIGDVRAVPPRITLGQLLALHVIEGMPPSSIVMDALTKALGPRKGKALLGEVRQSGLTPEVFHRVVTALGLTGQWVEEEIDRRIPPPAGPMHPTDAKLFTEPRVGMRMQAQFDRAVEVEAQVRAHLREADGRSLREPALTHRQLAELVGAVTVETITDWAGTQRWEREVYSRAFWMAGSQWNCRL